METRQTQVIMRNVLLACGGLILLAASSRVAIGQDFDTESSRPPINRVLVVAVASGEQLPDKNWENFQRFNRSVAANKLELTVLDQQQTTASSAGDKITEVELIKRALASYKNERDLLVFLVDGYRSVVNGGKRAILSRFAKLGKASTRIVFAADSECRPNTTEWLARYRFAGLVEASTDFVKEQPFLNSNLLLGYAPELWALIGDASPDETLQEISQRMYLDPEKRTKLGLELDHKSEIFQTITEHIAPHLELHIEEQDESRTVAVLRNSLLSTEPIAVHASGQSTATAVVNSLGNYLGGAWSLHLGCVHCNASRLSLGRDTSNWPMVLIGAFVEEPTPFLDDFFRTIRELDYPRKRIHLFVHNGVKFHAKQVQTFLDEYGPSYASYKLLSNFSLTETPSASGVGAALGSSILDDDTNSLSSSAGMHVSEWQARDHGFEWCSTKASQCDYYLSLDSVARLELPETLKLLIESNRNVVAPMLSRYRKLWSNFWAAITPEGFYSRSSDYVELVKRSRNGLWLVPHITNAYLIRGDFIRGQLMAAGAAAAAAAAPGPISAPSGAQSRPGGPATRDLAKLTNGSVTSNGGQPSTIDYEMTPASAPPAVATAQLSFQGQMQPKTAASPVKPSLLFSQQLRAMGINQYVLNTHDFGHLADPTGYNIALVHADFYQLETNMIDWERNYIHENYSAIFEGDPEDGDDDDDEEDDVASADKTKTKKPTKLPAQGPRPSKFIEQPCPDVYWFPLVSERFSSHLIDIMESFGRWSGGDHEDSRIEGGYESVPTRDIHFRQVGLHEMWLLFLREYVQPVQLRQYTGYDHDPPSADLAFVVRYNPNEQASLRPHHDASTYTMNIALNSPQVHYEGGGCRFVRYNCSVVDTRQGWALIHPGRLTHYHEGLAVTRGTRYILVTFIDP